MDLMSVRKYLIATHSVAIYYAIFLAVFSSHAVQTLAAFTVLDLTKEQNLIA